MQLRIVAVAIVALACCSTVSVVQAEHAVLVAAQRLALLQKLRTLVRDGIYYSSRWSIDSILTTPTKSSSTRNSNESIVGDTANVSGEFDPIVKLLEALLNYLEHVLVKSECKRDLIAIVMDLRNATKKRPPDTWAFSYFDASGKLGSGLAHGNLQILGSIDECLENEGTDQGRPFNPHYCTAYIGEVRKQNGSIVVPDAGTMSVAAGLGLCLPETCAGGDVMTVINSFLKTVEKIVELPMKNKPDIEVLRVQCFANDDKITWDASSTVAIIIIAVTVLLLLAGTFIDAALGGVARFRAQSAAEATGIVPTQDVGAPAVDKQHGLIRFFVCWSILRNGQKILSVVTAKSVRSDVPPLHCVHGIRFISMCWVIYAHAYVFSLQTLKDPVRFINAVGEWWFQGISNASFSVDTFFFLSGMLLAYVVTAQERQHKRINWIQYYVHRYWRLTPPYLLTLAVVGGLLKYTNAGPFWQPEMYFPNQCKDSWWTNALYINNFVHLFDGCMQWAWYLANDMQFYFFSPIIIIPFFFRRTLGMIVWALCLIGFFVATICLTVTYDLPSNITSAMRNIAKSDADLQRFMNYFSIYYIKPWTRVGPYLIGVAFGYLIFEAKTRRWRMKSWQAVLGWPLVFAASAAIIFSLQGETAGERVLSPAEAAIYNILTRPAWGLLLGFIVLACETGAGGFATTILSFKGFVPLSRLAYCTYLIHPIVMIYVYEGMAQSFAFSHATIGLFGFGFIFASFSCGFVLSLMFEAPALALERLLTSEVQRGSRSRRRVVEITPMPPTVSVPPPTMLYMPASANAIGSYDVNTPVTVVGINSGSPAVMRRFAATPSNGVSKKQGEYKT